MPSKINVGQLLHWFQQSFESITLTVHKSTNSQLLLCTGVRRHKIYKGTSRTSRQLKW